MKVSRVRGETSYRNNLIRVGHHCDEHIEQNDYVNDGIGAEQKEGPEPGEASDALEIERREIHHAKGGPEQGLRCLEEAEEKHIT